MNFKEFTPTQQRMLHVLLDGAPHPAEDLHACLGDQLQPLNVVKDQISRMRPVLANSGFDIVCRFHLPSNTNTWRLVRYYAPDE